MKLIKLPSCRFSNTWPAAVVTVVPFAPFQIIDNSVNGLMSLQVSTCSGVGGFSGTTTVRGTVS